MPTFSPQHTRFPRPAFGYATGSGQALRSALDDEADAEDPAAEKERKRERLKRQLYETVTEPHERGSILVAAVFDAFFATYKKRIKDLIRIATGGSGVLPEGDLHPTSSGGSPRRLRRPPRTSSRCRSGLRLPPAVDVTFGDFLRALVTADTELVPDDDRGLRASMIEAFRVRGVYPDDVVSLAEESLLWENRTGEVPDLPVNLLRQELVLSARAFDRYAPGRQSDEDPTGVWARALRRWATENARAPRSRSRPSRRSRRLPHRLPRLARRAIAHRARRPVRPDRTAAQGVLPLRADDDRGVVGGKGPVRPSRRPSRRRGSGRGAPEGERRAALQARSPRRPTSAIPPGLGDARSLGRRRAHVSFAALHRAAWRTR